jgi:hypothetical protein
MQRLGATKILDFQVVCRVTAIAIPMLAIMDNID